MSEQILNQILAELSGINQRLSGIENRLDNIEARLDKVEARLDNLEGQVQENTQFIKALLHRTEELDAKYDALLNNTATKDSVIRLEAKIDVIAHRIFEQEAEITLLKRAK